jgi:antitoxin YefM
VVDPESNLLLDNSPKRMYSITVHHSPGGSMPIQTTYTQARANLASLWDEVTRNREVIIIERRGAESVALISADELEGLLETAYLLRSPENAERLLRALTRARQKEGVPQTIEELKREVGFGEIAEG